MEILSYSVKKTTGNTVYTIERVQFTYIVLYFHISNLLVQYRGILEAAATLPFLIYTLRGILEILQISIQIGRFYFRESRSFLIVFLSMEILSYVFMFVIFNYISPCAVFFLQLEFYLGVFASVFLIARTHLCLVSLTYVSHCWYSLFQCSSRLFFNKISTFNRKLLISCKYQTLCMQYELVQCNWCNIPCF